MRIYTAQKLSLYSYNEHVHLSTDISIARYVDMLIVNSIYLYIKFKMAIFTGP
jgi:hypothetical protein